MAQAFATFPIFHTQVLHLMKKMHLSPPFVVKQPPIRTTCWQATLNEPQAPSKVQESSSDSERFRIRKR